MTVPAVVGRANMSLTGTNGSERTSSRPFRRSSTYTRPVLLAWASAGTTEPPSRSEKSSIGLEASRSHRSCGLSWKYHRSVPVRASRARIEHPNRLSPGRGVSSSAGAGLPVPT